MRVILYFVYYKLKYAMGIINTVVKTKCIRPLNLILREKV